MYTILYNYREFETLYDDLDHGFNIYTDYQKANLCKWFSYTVEKQDGRDGSLLANNNEWGNAFKMLVKSKNIQVWEKCNAGRALPIFFSGLNCLN